MDSKCSKCNEEVHVGDLFCPHCGLKIASADVPISIWQAVKIYLATVLLAPFGLYWFFKFCKSKDPKKRRLAYIVLIITSIVTTVSVVMGARVAELYKSYINNYFSESTLYGL